MIIRGGMAWSSRYKEIRFSEADILHMRDEAVKEGRDRDLINFFEVLLYSLDKKV